MAIQHILWAMSSIITSLHNIQNVLLGLNVTSCFLIGSPKQVLSKFLHIHVNLLVNMVYYFFIVPSFL